MKSILCLASSLIFVGSVVQATFLAPTQEESYQVSNQHFELYGSTPLLSLEHITFTAEE
jgi:hypothetical protein